MTKTGTIERVCLTAAPTLNGVIRDLTTAQWIQPMELKIDHEFRCVGAVMDIWREGSELRFRAHVTDLETWAQIEAGEITACSIEAGHDVEFEGADGLRHVKEWSIVAISLLSPGHLPGCPDAGVIKINRGAIPVAPPLPQVPEPAPVDPRRVELASIRARTAEVEQSLARIRRERFVDGLDHSVADGLEKAETVLKREYADLVERKTLIECGVDLSATETPDKKTVPRRAARKWDVKEMPEPAYPTGARKGGDRAALDRAFGDFHDYYINESVKRAAELGVQLNSPLTMEGAVMLRGVLDACLAWLSERSAELEARVAELESTRQHFAGVHQRALAYKHGALVTHHGNLWAAIGDVPQGVIPGTSPSWQLAVRKGDAE